MRLKVDAYMKRAFTRVAVIRGDDELMFDAGGYRSVRMIQLSHPGYDQDSLFNEANEFISRLDERDQKDLFEIYARLESYYADYDYSADDVEATSVNDYLRDITKQIFSIIRYDDLYDYIKGNMSLRIPADVHRTYTTEDKITQSYTDKTYLIEDYMHLMAFTLGQRFMIPVWGPYSKILERTDGERMKDYTAFCLLQGTEMWESQAFERAEVYVEANLKKNVKNLSAMLNFLSKEEIPAYLIAQTSLRKFSVAPISSGPDDSGHLMRILHGYATSQFEQMDKKIQPDVLTKENHHEFADDNTSVFGTYKMKEQISIGDLAIIQNYVANYKRAAAKIEPDINLDYVEACVVAAIGLKNYRPSETQRGLAAWVASYIIPSVAIQMFDRVHLMTAMGITQAVLWHWGYHELAILVTAKPIPRDDNEHRSREGRSHLSKDLAEHLDVIYPWTFPTNAYIPGGESPNVGIRGIELIASAFNKEEWEPTCPKALAKLHEHSHLSRRIDPSHNLRDQLANLLIRLDAQV